MIRAMMSRDLDGVVAVHLRGFPGFFLSSMGPRFLRLYYTGICGDPDGVALVFDDGGRIAGFVAGSVNPRGFYTRLLRRDWPRFALAGLGQALRRPSAAIRLLRALRYPAQNPAGDGTAGLYSIAVDPRAQTRGIGAQLVSAFLAEAHRRGAGRVFLTTDRDGNESVNHFYLNLGFRAQRQFATPEGRWMNEYWIDLAPGGHRDG